MYGASHLKFSVVTVLESSKILPELDVKSNSVYRRSTMSKCPSGICYVRVGQYARFAACSLRPEAKL